MNHKIFLLFSIIIVGRLCAMDVQKEEAPLSFENPTAPSSSVSGNTKPSKQSFTFDVNSLINLAPLAMVMYCFDQSPRITMITITTLLLYILMQDEGVKSRMNRLQVNLIRKWYKIKVKSCCLWHYL